MKYSIMMAANGGWVTPPAIPPIQWQKDVHQENNRKASKKHQQKSLTVWKYKPDNGTVHNPACQRTSAVRYINKLSKLNTKEIIWQNKVDAFSLHLDG